MLLFKKIVPVTLFIFLFSVSLAQIKGLGHYIVKPTEYKLPVISGNDTIWLADSIYIFHTPVGSGWPVNMKIEAKLEGQHNLTFTWYRFNRYEWLYSDSLKTDSLTDVSVIENLESGGYMVHIRGQAIDTIFRAWVYANYFRAKLRQNSTCEEVELSWFREPSVMSGKSFYYYFWHDSSTFILKNGLKIKWSARKRLDSGELVADTLDFNSLLYPNFTLYDDYRFYIAIDDSLENHFTDSIDFVAISVKPFFRASRAKPYPAFETDTTGEAPFRVMFIDSSLNAEKFTWVFHKPRHLWKDKNDTVLLIKNEKILADSIIYTTPSSYDVELIVEGPKYYIAGESKRCRESLRKNEMIQIDSSFIGDPKKKEFPNVFTPNNDGRNDYFKPIPVKDTGNYFAGSLQTFEVYIYSRWGNRVYHFKADNQDDYHHWKGWNGKVGGEGVEAPPGIYFFVIRGKGYDGILRQRKGYLYLFRSVNDMRSMPDE